MFPILLHLGPLTVRTYGVFVAGAFLISLRLAVWLAKEPRLPDHFLMDLAALLILSGLVGARVFYVFVNMAHFVENPGEIWRIWEGGLVFYGGFLVAAAAGAYFTQRRGQNLAQVADIVAPCVALGQAVGRWGCFFAGCCYGKPTSFWTGVQFDHPASLAPLGIGLHPTQIYESLGNLVIAGYLSWRLVKKPTAPGNVFWLYVLLYGILRFGVEMLRGDVRGALFGGLFPSQWIALGAVVLSLCILITQVASKNDAHT